MIAISYVEHAVVVLVDFISVLLLPTTATVNVKYSRPLMCIIVHHASGTTTINNNKQMNNILFKKIKIFTLVNKLLMTN
jgi:hypothetical protein